MTAGVIATSGAALELPEERRSLIVTGGHAPSRDVKITSIKDLPEFIRELVAEHLGMRIEDINTWIDSDEPHAHKLIEDSILYLDELCKDEQERRAAEAEEENDAKGGES